MSRGRRDASEKENKTMQLYCWESMVILCDSWVECEYSLSWSLGFVLLWAVQCQETFRVESSNVESDIVDILMYFSIQNMPMRFLYLVFE